MNELKDHAINAMKHVSDKAEDVAHQGVSEVKQGSADWLEYILEHPVQSSIFAIIGLYAVKGFFKK